VFVQPISYLRRESSSGSHGRVWSYSFHLPSGDVFLEARFPEIPKEATVFLPSQPATPLLRLKAWRWFWWNGRYDVLDTATGTRLATLRRTGGVEGASGRRIGSVRNAMPVRKSLFRSLISGVLDSILSGGEDASSVPIDEFRVDAGNMRIGTLRRMPLPFTPAETGPTARKPAQGRGWLRWLRSRLTKTFPPRGWLLDYSDDREGRMDPRVRLAAALFRIQIEERYS